MTHDPLRRVYDAIEAADCQPHGPAHKFVAHCPAHDDRLPSLSVGEGADGRALLYCHAGCPVEHVLAALGLEFVDLFPEGHRRGRPAKPLPPARPGHLTGPLGAAIDYIAALAELDQRITISVMAPRCFSCGAQGAWLRADRHGVTLDCPEGCDGGAVAGALSRMVTDAGRLRRAA